MAPKAMTFGLNRNIIRYRYYNYRKDYSESYNPAMDNFFDYSILSRWRELLEESNYRING